VLNTASIAGFEPGPTMSVYHASKAFVLSWSEAIATELEDSGVTVTALCPGPTDTDFFPKGDLEDSFAFQKANLMDPEEVAQIGYEAAMGGERVVVAGAVNKAMVFSRRFMSEQMQARMNEKMYEDVDSPKRMRGDKESPPHR
jgi:short-subunit dehydrogenase